MKRALINSALLLLLLFLPLSLSLPPPWRYFSSSLPLHAFFLLLSVACQADAEKYEEGEQKKSHYRRRLSPPLIHRVSPISNATRSLSGAPSVCFACFPFLSFSSRSFAAWTDGIQKIFLARKHTSTCLHIQIRRERYCNNSKLFFLKGNHYHHHHQRLRQLFFFFFCSGFSPPLRLAAPSLYFLSRSFSVIRSFFFPLRYFPSKNYSCSSRLLKKETRRERQGLQHEIHPLTLSSSFQINFEIDPYLCSSFLLLKGLVPRLLLDSKRKIERETKRQRD